MSYKYKAKDLPYSQKANEGTFRGYFDLEDGEITFGNNGINQYDNSDYDLNAYIMNRIIDDVKANAGNNPPTMQGYWNATVLQDLENKKQLFQTWINKMSEWTNGEKREWASGSSNTYTKGELVTHDDDGAFYLCIQNCTGAQALPSSGANSYWAKFYIQGRKGKPSFTNLNYLGEFNWQTYTFAVDDLVFVIDKHYVTFYVCKSAVTYSTEASPATDTTHWTVMFTIPRMSFDIWDAMPSPIASELNTAFALKDSNDDSLIDIIDKRNTSDLKYLSLMTSMSQVMVDNTASDAKLISLIQEYNL